MDVRVGLWRKLSAEELTLLNCGAGENSWESLDCKEIQPVHPKGDQSWIFTGRTDAEAETPIHLMRRTDSLEKTLMLGKIEDRRRREWQRMWCLDGIIDTKDMSLSKFWEIVKDREAWHATVHGVVKSQTRLINEQQQVPVCACMCVYIYIYIYILFQILFPYRLLQNIK